MMKSVQCDRRQLNGKSLSTIGIQPLKCKKKKKNGFSGIFEQWTMAISQPHKGTCSGFAMHFEH